MENLERLIDLREEIGGVVGPASGRSAESAVSVCFGGERREGERGGWR
jgi:hypothetical protein